MKTQPFIEVDASTCTGCGICAEDCTFEAIVIENNTAKILETCKGCLCCLQACPAEAISKSKHSPRVLLQQKNRQSSEQTLGAIFGSNFLRRGNG